MEFHHVDLDLGYRFTDSPAEVVELANTGFEVVTSGGKVKSGTVADLFDANGFFLSDPQVIWDASTNRFYVSMFENRGSSSPDEGLAWGFSKTAHPSSAAVSSPSGYDPEPASSASIVLPGSTGNIR